MSTRFLAMSAALVFGLCSLPAHAMPPGPAPHLPPAPPQRLDAPGLIGQYAVEGQVQRMLTNPYGEVDGLRLSDGTIAKFPPHMADALTATVKVGDTVRVIGRAEARGTVRADAIVHAGNGRTVYDQPPPAGEGRVLPPHLRAQRLQPLQAEGRVETVLTGPRGEANGVILSDGTIVRFPPESLRLSVQAGAPFAASGLGTRNAFGTSLEAVSMGTTLSALQPLYDRVP
ncbi:hypothetical protein [Cupriavidus malaysiensis]|uniref:Secreted protein n=1 Tax=Cupriavidus malaysiensis TaxID=367825 RepID=A0ABN4TNQ7_9BURK|nr:hypothetical protein [Cupriavidus malaysiensis]AOZ08613.1 hypothetical protein BKK80_21975 [Cupriavidus malaysiensis]